MFISSLRYYREVLPGEIVQISKNGVRSLSIVPRPEGDLPAFCIFEYVYFARPDSIFEGIYVCTYRTGEKKKFIVQLLCSIKCKCPAGQMVYTVRQRCGQQLAIEAPTEADVVSTVPESATPAALGYAQQVCLQTLWLFCHLVDLFPYKHIPSCPSSRVFPTWRFCVRTAMLAELLFSQIPA